MEFSEKTKEHGRYIENMVNSFSFKPAELCQYLAQNAHRTLQQSITNFALEWIKTVASDDYRYDGRNELSHIACKELINGREIDRLPMI